LLAIVFDRNCTRERLFIFVTLHSLHVNGFFSRKKRK
jgi:hypothetical protein